MTALRLRETLGRLREPLGRLGRALVRPRGNRLWSGVVRGTGILALLAIPLVTYRPGTGSLAGFLLVTIWVNGPIAPLLPATYEPILMLFGRIHAPLLVAVVGTAGTLYVEFLNYHLYRKALELDMAERLRENRLVRRVVALFERMPFFTIWLCSWSILPYWSVRFLSPLSGYPVDRQLLATLLGRLPRLWFFAALGLWWNVGTGVLLAITGGGICLGVGAWAYRRLADTRREARTAAALPTSGS